MIQKENISFICEGFQLRNIRNKIVMLLGMPKQSSVLPCSELSCFLSPTAPCSKTSFNVPLNINLFSWLYELVEFYVRSLSFIFLFWGRICWGTKLCPVHFSQSRHESLLKLDPALNFAYVDLMYNICLTNGLFQKSQNLRCHDWWKIPSNPINTNEEVIKYENFRWINCHLVCYDVMNNGHLEFY